MGARRTVAGLGGAAPGFRRSDGHRDVEWRRPGHRRQGDRCGRDRPETQAALHRRLDRPTRQRPAPLRSRPGLRQADPKAESSTYLRLRSAPADRTTKGFQTICLLEIEARDEGLEAVVVAGYAACCSTASTAALHAAK